MNHNLLDLRSQVNISHKFPIIAKLSSRLVSQFVLVEANNSKIWHSLVSFGYLDAVFLVSPVLSLSPNVRSFLNRESGEGNLEHSSFNLASTNVQLQNRGAREQLSAHAIILLSNVCSIQIHSGSLMHHGLRLGFLCLGV